MQEIDKIHALTIGWTEAQLMALAGRIEDLARADRPALSHAAPPALA